jgi:hypothetical protein
VVLTLAVTEALVAMWMTPPDPIDWETLWSGAHRELRRSACVEDVRSRVLPAITRRGKRELGTGTMIGEQWTHRTRTEPIEATSRARRLAVTAERVYAGDADDPLGANRREVNP